jgi:hypothetical protein
MIEEISDPSYATVQGLIKHALDDDVEISSSEKSGAGISSFFDKVVEWFKSLLP